MRTSGRGFAALVTALLVLGGTAIAGPATAAVPVAAAPGTVAPSAVAPGAVVLVAAKRPAKVTVPARYVYNPKLGARHDYCTAAPDEFPAPRAVNADFRGPCARHDLCYDGPASKKSCDKALRRNLFQNCEHYYGRYNPLRTACKAAALVYWAAVVAS